MDITHEETVDVSGNEALNIGERIKLFYSEISLGVDKFNAAYLNSSIHTVETNKVFEELKKKNTYFSFSSNQIPTPVFFNPKKITFKLYVTLVSRIDSFLKVTNDELDRMYAAIKMTAATGELPFAIRRMDNLQAFDAFKKALVTDLQNTNVYTRAINQVYPNMNEALETFAIYNNAVKNIKSRDTEIVAKKVDNLVDILKILKRKVESGDVTLSPDDFNTIDMLTKRTNDLVSTLGSYFALANELTRILELQVTEFKRYV